MNRFSRYTIIVILLNVALVLLLLSPIYLGFAKDALNALIVAFAIVTISGCIQVIVALSFLASKSRKELGQAILSAIGIIILIGFSICSGC